MHHKSVLTGGVVAIVSTDKWCICHELSDIARKYCAAKEQQKRGVPTKHNSSCAKRFQTLLRSVLHPSTPRTFVRSGVGVNNRAVWHMRKKQSLVVEMRYSFSLPKHKTRLPAGTQSFERWQVSNVRFFIVSRCVMSSLSIFCVDILSRHCKFLSGLIHVYLILSVYFSLPRCCTPPRAPMTRCNDRWAPLPC